METLNTTPAVEQSEPASQAEPVAATSVASVASADENAQAEAVSSLTASAPAMPDHAFVFSPSPLDPSGVKCGVEGCMVSEPFHPQEPFRPQAAIAAQPPGPEVAAQEDNGEPHPHELERMLDEGGPCPDKPRVTPQAVIGSEILQPVALADDDRTALSIDQCVQRSQAGSALPKPSLEDRVAKIEAELEALRPILAHHGLRGPQA